MLISDEYRRLNAQMHLDKPGYGVTGIMKNGKPTRNIGIIETIRAVTLNARATSILDYGCGKGAVKAALKDLFDVREYDPAIPGKDAMPEPAEIVCCLDVLEHVEPDCLESVLAHIGQLAKKAVVFEVYLQPAKKTLPDGRNAHLIVEGPRFWVPKIGSRWHLSMARATLAKLVFVGSV